MTTQFKDFDELYDPLVLPIGGKEYRIPAPAFDAGVKIFAVADGTEKLADEELFRLLLGDVFDEMLADKVPALGIIRAGQTALSDFKYGREMALTMWETGGDPKAIADRAQQSSPNRASRRSRGTAAASKTQ